MRSSDLKHGMIVYVSALLADSAYLLRHVFPSAIRQRKIGARGIVKYVVPSDPTLWSVLHDSEFGGLIGVYKAAELTASKDAAALLAFIGASPMDEYEKGQNE